MKLDEDLHKGSCKKILNRHRGHGYFVKPAEQTCKEAAGEDFSAVTLVQGRRWSDACNGDPEADVSICQIPGRALAQTRKAATRAGETVTGIDEVVAAYLEGSGTAASDLELKERKVKCSGLEHHHHHHDHDHAHDHDK